MDVIWTVSHATLTGAERCRVRDTGQGWVLSGVVAASYEARPIDVQYRVAVDEGWATRSVNVTMDLLTQSRQLQLERSAEGRWTVDGRLARELDACVDVDLGLLAPLVRTRADRARQLHVDQLLQRRLQQPAEQLPGVPITETCEQVSKPCVIMFVPSCGTPLRALGRTR